MMIASVAAVLAAMLGGAALYDYGRRIEGLALSGLITVGVLWTNVVAYHHARPAPQQRFAELTAIDSRFNDTGPTLYNLWDEEFPTYFLRHLGVVVPGFFIYVTPRPGTSPRTPAQIQVPWDTNDMDLAWLEYFRLLVSGRSPVLSRPPANYRLAYQDRSYDVWRRAATPRVLEHISVSGGLHPGGPLSCTQIKRVGHQAVRAHARIDYVTRPILTTFDPVRAAHPKAWFPNNLDDSRPPDMLQLNEQAGKVTGTIDVRTPGRYHVWLEGTLTQRVTVLIDGRPVGSLAGQTGPAGLWADVGTVSVPAGRHSVAIRRSAESLGPSPDALNADQLGPLMLVAGSEVQPVRQVTAGRAASLCGRPLEWLEVVR